jgi:hypothetical protein
MGDPLTRPKTRYGLLPESERGLVDQLFATLFTHAANIPSLKRLSPENAKKAAIGMLDLGLLKVCREDGKAWLEIHNGKVYVRV